MIIFSHLADCFLSFKEVVLHKDNEILSQGLSRFHRYLLNRVENRPEMKNRVLAIEYLKQSLRKMRARNDQMSEYHQNLSKE